MHSRLFSSSTPSLSLRFNEVFRRCRIRISSGQPFFHLQQQRHLSPRISSIRATSSGPTASSRPKSSWNGSAYHSSAIGDPGPLRLDAFHVQEVTPHKPSMLGETNVRITALIKDIVIDNNTPNFALHSFFRQQHWFAPLRHLHPVPVNEKDPRRQQQLHPLNRRKPVHPLKAQKRTSSSVLTTSKAVNPLQPNFNLHEPCMRVLQPPWISSIASY